MSETIQSMLISVATDYGRRSLLIWSVRPISGSETGCGPSFAEHRIEARFRLPAQCGRGPPPPFPPFFFWGAVPLRAGYREPPYSMPVMPSCEIGKTVLIERCEIAARESSMIRPGRVVRLGLREQWRRASLRKSLERVFDRFIYNQGPLAKADRTRVVDFLRIIGGWMVICLPATTRRGPHSLSSYLESHQRVFAETTVSVEGDR